MAGLVECVPNFSEGKDAAVVDAIVAAMAAVPGIRLLDRSMDAGHNRSVVTILGSPEAVGEAAFRGVAEAARLIDLRSHRGEHPRMGAADVVPFVPVRGVSTEECVELARRVAERIGRELSIPVFLYEAAATRPERKNLADVRAPQFEGLSELIGTDPSRDPDYGPRAIHPTAGAVAVGARPLLVAYNVYLNSSDLSVAKAIARAVRNQTGGLRYVKALGIAPNEEGRVHVSMNLVNTAGTPIHRVVEMIRSEAARYGVSVAESEVVGLVSADALLDAAEHYLQLNRFSRSQVLEYRLLEDAAPSGLLDETVAGFAGRVASSAAVPGGGTVAALMGALAAALVAMVARLTIGRKRFADVEEKMKELEARGEAVRERLQRLAEADSAAYLEYMDAAKLAKSGGAKAQARLQAASLRAAEVPLESARAALEAMEIARDGCRLGNPVARTDACVAVLGGYAAVMGAGLNVKVNLPSLSPDQHPETLEAEVASLEERAKAILAEVVP
ncbi:MAG TPA: glutamate formimidoyltransferase [Chloroflexota bacterium]|nr:glutamate formimidoyltransferase [Chloroflexota bacterium]